MIIYKFSKDKDSDRVYQYKVLVYPNITYMKDLEKDSYVVVLRNVIKELNKVRDDIHWTILSPYEIQSLVFPNTTQLPIELPSYPNAMRTHFNHKQLLKTIDWKKNDYDVVYSHLPEHTLQLSNMFANETNINPKFIGYCHWFEVPENTAYSKKMLMHNIAGILDWWKPKAIKRYTNLLEQGRLNDEILYYNQMCGLTWKEAKDKYISEVGR